MDKLKVYLNRHNRQNKSTLEQVKTKMLKNNSNMWESYNQKSNQKHNISQNNLSKSSNMRKERNLSQKIKIITSKQQRTYQQLQQLKSELKQIKYPARYDSNGNTNKNQGKIIAQIKKTPKLTISETKINYKSQPYFDIQKSKRRNHSNQKRFSEFIYKNVKQSKNNLELVIKSTQQTKSKYKQNQQVIPRSNKNAYLQKIPAKKRSKSARMDAKKKEEQLKKQKQKRTCSLKRNVQMEPDEKKQKKVKESSKNKNQLIQIEFKTMFRTRKGVQITNPNKVNQDRLFIQENHETNCNNSINLYSIADGHGPYGHFVSSFIMQNLLKKIQYYLNEKKTTKTSLQKSYKDIQNALQKNPELNADFSGSTLVTILIQNEKTITCANVGDSRAIVARQLNKNNWEIIRLSNDHKPHVEQQKKRILAHGGRVQPVYDENGKSLGPMRVWLPKKQIQGLAMSRSLGDNISKPIGVTYIPQILSHDITEDDKFILLASDGVWQFLSNYQILCLLIPFYRENKLEDACQALMRQAYRSWTTQDNSVIDDITFILIFIHANKSKNLDKNNHNSQKQNQFHITDFAEDQEYLKQKNFSLCQKDVKILKKEQTNEIFEKNHRQ